MEFKTVKDSIDKFKVCVIVPTYNNDKTLKRVLDSILEYTDKVIIVNDGSTDETSAILKAYSNLIQIHHSKNSGKGIALRNGFKKAIDLGYEYAITIDSDGQHFSSDIPKFLNEITLNDTVLLIGSRNMAQDGVPKKSSFGNKFSNFWFWFETGIKLEDTQSGYRLYPLKMIPKKYFTNKFEFEIEIIVRSAWKGVTVRNIPIQVLYDPLERVSHFRPFKDFETIAIEAPLYATKTTSLSEDILSSFLANSLLFTSESYAFTYSFLISSIFVLTENNNKKKNEAIIFIAIQFYKHSTTLMLWFLQRK